MPVCPAPAVMPNTGLVPADLPAQQRGSLAPADPTPYQDSSTATPVAHGPQPYQGADRAQGVEAAPYAAHAGVAHKHPTDAAAPMSAQKSTLTKRAAKCLTRWAAPGRSATASPANQKPAIVRSDGTLLSLVLPCNIPASPGIPVPPPRARVCGKRREG